MNDADDTAQEVFDTVSEDPQARAIDELDGRGPALAAALRRAIPFLFRGGVAVTADPTEATTVAEILREFETPRHVLPFNIEPEGVPGLLLSDASACAFLLDGALGGDGTNPPALLPEGLTGPQRALILRILAGVIPSLGAVMEPGLGLSLRRSASPDDTKPTDAVLAMRFRLGEGGAHGSMALALDQKAVLAALGAARNSAELDPILAAALGAVHVELVAELGRLRLTLGEVATLQVGDVLTLSTQVGSAVSVRIDGRVLFRAHPITSGTHVAVRVAGGTRLESVSMPPTQGDKLP